MGTDFVFKPILISFITIVRQKRSLSTKPYFFTNFIKFKSSNNLKVFSLVFTMAKTDTFEVIEICHELGDPNELYQLNWSARDEIIVNLNRYTQLLCGEKIESETLMYENADLYQALIVLPLKSEPSSPASTGQPAAGRPSNRVVLDLDGSLRLQIVSALMTNHSLAVDGESASVEAKQKMIERNNKLIVKLVNLPINLNAGSTNGVAVKGKWL